MIDTRTETREVEQEFRYIVCDFCGEECSPDEMYYRIEEVIPEGWNYVHVDSMTGGDKVREEFHSCPDCDIAEMTVNGETDHA